MARKLASMNASVTLACRNMQKAEAAKEKLAPYSANIQCMQLDCSSLKRYCTVPLARALLRRSAAY